MLKIKLARTGKKNQAHFRIVVNEARDKRDGAVVAHIGHYIPAQVPKVLEIDVKEYESWIKKGAQPTETVAALFKRYQSGNPFPEKKPELSRKAKAKAAAAAEAAKQAEAAPEAPVAETPAEPVAEAATEMATEPAPAPEAPAAEKTEEAK
jgi:small subunit ribosomal protein S16